MIETAEQLVDLLLNYGVHVDEWGKGNAKTVNQLLKEVQSGETRLLYDDDILIRFFMGVIVHVYFNGMKLVEDRQEFADGRVRERGFDFLAEKMPANENPDEAAVRCLDEEIDVSGVYFEAIAEEVLPHADSMSYPGILTIGKLFHYRVDLPVEHFKAEGYIEEQPDKTNYYSWRIRA